MLGSFVWSQESDALILLDLSQVGIFYGSVIWETLWDRQLRLSCPKVFTVYQIQPLEAFVYGKL